MQTIYKYPISPAIQTTIRAVSIPKGGRVLSVESQGSVIVLYAMVDHDEKELMEVQVEVYGTGRPVPDTTNLLFLGTVKLFDGGLMYHVFVRVDQRENVIPINRLRSR